MRLGYLQFLKFSAVKNATFTGAYLRKAKLCVERDIPLEIEWLLPPSQLRDAVWNSAINICTALGERVKFE